MIFDIKDGYFSYGSNIIGFAIFELLTGIRINLWQRIGKSIYIMREKGHIYLYDTEFIEGQLYYKDKICYKCERVNNGKALLSPIGSMNVITSNTPGEFRIN
jgi:hypothetical protein